VPAAAPAPAAYEYEPVAPAPRSLALAGSYAIDYTLLADAEKLRNGYMPAWYQYQAAQLK